MLLTLFMIITSFPLNAFAAQTETNVRNEITDIRTVGDKQVINLGNVRGEKPQLRFFFRSARLGGATTPQAGNSDETVAQKVEINLATMGLNLEEEQFDPSALTEVGSFDVEITFKELGGARTEKRKMTFQAGETKKTETFYLPKDMGQGVVEAEIPKLKDTISLRVYVSGNSTTSFNLGQDMTYKFELSQIVHPVIDLKVVDPYGKELQENINQDLGLKLVLEEEEHEFDLPANTKTLNIRTLADFAGDGIEDLNSTGDNPTLSLTTALDKDKRLKVGDKTYKLNKITYKALGQEVEINGQKKKVGGYIEFATQPKIIVPTPDDSGNLPKTPDGYKRLSFHAETSANANDGKFEQGEKLKVIDVLEGTEYTDKDLQDQIKGIGQPTPIINGRKDDNKKFLKWKPELPTTGPVADTDFRPVYLADGGEITPGEKLPDGVFEVKVIKDDTIAKDADDLYGKSYGVFKGSKLARDKFPDLEAEKGHQNPKWTTEAEDPTNGMVDIAKPWTKVITKATTFKATAAEKAATKIGKDGLKAVDTTALQGQELDEKFWHKGVELADNTPADKKNAFAALLKDATVTDITNPARTTAEAGDKVGTLLVTFKDGSTLEVPNQKLIVKPNTVKVELDKDAQGAEKPLRDGDTTVKGKISASSNSDKFPVSLDGALVTIKKGDTVLSRTLAKADGSFVAGVKDPLVAGENISVVVTLPESKTESTPVTEKVQLNPDKLNSIIPTGEAVVKNLEGKKGVDQTKVATLKAAIQKAYDDLVVKAPQGKKQKDQKAKSTVTVDADGQKSLDNQYEAIKKAIEELRGNSAPIVNGTTSHKEIFKGDTLNLEDGIIVTDKDSTEKVSDIAQVDNKDFTYKVDKIEKDTRTEITKENLAKINQTPGTYEVTYTAKDKSGAEGKFVMTLVVKEPVVEIKDNFPEVIPEGYVKVEFKEGAHGTLEGTTKFLVKDGSAKTVLNAPTIKPNVNYEATKDANWKPVLPDKFTGTEENKKSFTFTAQYTYTGSDIVEQKPGDKKPDVPENFVKVEFKKGDHGVISSEYTTIYWVNPERNKTLADITKPIVTALEGYKFTGWDKVDTDAIGKDGLTVTAQYKAKVVTEDPHDAENYAKVDFVAGDQGKFEQVGGKDQVTTFWVLKKEDVKFNAPVVTANNGFVFSGWNPALQTKYTEDKTHTAKYEPKSDISDVPVAGFQEVKFLAGKDGKFEGDKTEKSVWVRPGVKVDLTTKAPKVIANEGKVHTGWKPSLIGTFTKSETATEITAQYKTDADNNGVADEDETTPAPTAKALNVGKDPKSTTITGKAVPGAKVVAKTTIDNKEVVVGEATADNNGDYKIEAKKDNAALPKDTKVQVTAKVGEKQESKPTEAVVKEDKDGNGVDDEKEKFNIKKATKDEIIKNPDKMNYLVNTPEGKAKFETKGLVVKFTDDSGKSATYTAEELAKMNDVTIKPANNEEIGLAPEGKTNKMDLTVTVTGAEATDKPTVKANKQVVVQLDADGNKIADEDEFSTTPESVKAMNQNTEEGDPKKVTDKEKTTTTVTGKVKPGATVKITSKDGKTDLTPVGGVTVDQDGNFAAEITKQAFGTEIKVTATEKGKKESQPATAKVFRDSDNDGEDDKLAGQTERPAALASNIGKKPTFTTITGEAEKGATVTAYVGTQVVGTATADKTTGKYTIEAKQNNGPIKQGVKIGVTATLAPKAESLKQTVVVFNDTDGTGQPDSAKDFDVKKTTGMQVVASPDKMVYSDGDKLNLDGLKVLLTDVNGNQKIFTYKNADNSEFTNAGLSVDLKQETVLSSKDYDAQTAKDGHNGRKLVVTLDTTGNTSAEKAITGQTPTALTVNKNQSAQPTDVVAANQGDATVTKVKGKATKDAEIKITDASGQSLLPEGTTIKADANGDFTADLNKLLNPGTKVFVTATEPGKSESPKAETTVIRDKDGNWKPDTGAKLSTPVIDPIREKDEKVVVAAPKVDDKIQTIEVSDQNGKTVRLTKDPADTTGKTWIVEGSDPAEKVTENNEGKLEIPVKDKLPLNDRDQIKVTFKDGENPANEAFDKAPVQKASQTPKVDPVYTGDKSVKIADPTVADPTAKTIKVKVGDNDSMTVEKQPDGSWKVKEDPNKEVKVEDGKIVVPLDPSAKKGDVIKVSTINDSGKASPEAKVTVEDKAETKKPTINRANKDENTVSGTAAQNAEVTVTVTPKVGEPKTFTGKADGDGNFKVTTDPLVDGDTVIVKASEPGKADNTSDPKVVGVDTSKLKDSIDKAEDPTIGGKDGANLKPDENPVDKALKDALDNGKKVKEKGDNGDSNTDQKAVDKAKEDLDKAIAQKEADTAVDKAKDNPTPENIKDAQDKIDAIPGSKDPKAKDYNPIKKELQDKLDLIKIIKEAEKETKKEGYKDKPTQDKTALEKAIEDGKENLKNNTKITESTNTIQEKLNIIRMERIVVGVDSLSVGIKTLKIKTSVPGATVKIKIGGVLIDTIKTDAYGTFSKGLEAEIQEDQEIVLEASKPGYNDGIFNDTVY